MKKYEAENLVADLIVAVEKKDAAELAVRNGDNSLRARESARWLAHRVEMLKTTIVSELS